MNEPISQFLASKYKNTQCSTCQHFQTPQVSMFSPQCRAFKSQQNEQYPCSECDINLQKLTLQRKHNIEIEYENAKLKEQLEKLKADKKYLIQKIESIMKEKVGNNEIDIKSNEKQDLQAQLFQVKFLNQLLMLNQHPIPKQSDIELRDKYQKLLIEHYVMHEQLIIKDRIIKQQQFYPLHHYDARVRNLRNAVLHWYHIAIKDCKKIRQSIIQVKTDQKKMAIALKEKHSQMQSFLISSKFDKKIEKFQQKTPLPFKQISIQEPSHLHHNNNKKETNEKDKSKNMTLLLDGRKQKCNASKTKTKKKRNENKNKDKTITTATRPSCTHCSKPHCTSNALNLR